MLTLAAELFHWLSSSYFCPIPRQNCIHPVLNHPPVLTWMMARAAEAVFFPLHWQQLEQNTSFYLLCRKLRAALQDGVGIFEKQV